MKLHQVVEIPAEPARVWAFVMDIPSVASCVPGAEGVEALDDDHYRGRLRVRVGPVSLTLDGTVDVTARDARAQTAEMHIAAADPRVGGAVQATMTMSMTGIDGPTPATRLTIDTDARVMGRIGDFGQPIIKRKADQVVREFGENIARALSAEQTDGS
jgi:carbon monoxide dehydrogenase subunit G